MTRPADPPESLVAAAAVVHPGQSIQSAIDAATSGGIVLENVTVRDFIDNGIVLILGALAGLPASAFDDIEPNPDRVRVTRNRATGNGGISSIPFLPAVDLLWDGSGTGNCWLANRFGTAVPEPLPAYR